MAAVIFSVGLLAGPALAQNGGVGGEGDYQSTGQSGGVGGVAGVNGGVGGDGGAPNRSCNCTGGGGGGGAEGAAGGAGGPGGAGSRPVGGTGGGVGQDGATGAIGLGTASGGGGGGGAASGPSGATLNNTAMLTGGNGGKGGDGGVDHSDPSNRLAGGGGGGGAGGSAFTITGPGSDTNSGSITGGNGGAGGAGDVGGSGGDGGHGIVVTASGVTINNSGSISGGAGGAGGAQVSDTYSDGGDPVYGGTRGRPGAAGIGGSGIIGAGLTIINSGSIAGGTGSGVAGSAISFTGGANTLTSSGGTLTGNLGIANGVGASLTFLQTSAAGASGDLTISGITGLTGGATDAAVAIKIDGGRAFKITGASNYSGGTSVSDGSTIIIGNSNALGSGTLTMGETLAGHTTLVLNGNGLSIANNIVINSDPVVTVAAGNTNTMTGVISGAGDIVLNGGGTLVLSGANTYTGGTTICGTACGVAGGGSVLVVGTDTVGTPGAIVSSAIGTGRLTFDGGTLQAGGNYTIANEAAINANGGTIDSNGYRFTYSGNIADGAGGSGSLLIKDSTGTGAPVTLSGSNTYSGGTSVIGTTVRATNSSSFGSGAVTLQDARVQIGGTSNLTIANNFNINSSTYGSALDANGKTLTIAGNIADGNGPGRLTITDSTFRRSTVVLLGTNTYSGGTAICNCATLVLGDASHTASIVGQVSNDGFLYVRNANTSAITSLTNNGYTEFSGATIAGTMAITNQSSLAFLGASSAGNAKITQIIFGSTRFGTYGGTDTSTAGNATIDNTSAITIFAASTNAGTATIINRSYSSTTFYDQSSAAGATITNNSGGQTVFGGCCAIDTTTAGNAVITNNDGGQAWFQGHATAGSAVIITNSGGSTVFYGNSTGGNAQFITNDTGFVSFAGSLGANGDGRITAGSIAGSGTYYIGGGNTLVVGGNNLSTMVRGVIADVDPCGCAPAGPGSLEKTGSGTLTLSGTNSYTGTTTVNGGILQVDGSIASSSLTMVNAGGALVGVGTVGSTTIASGGILAPGSGTTGSAMTVAGNLAFQSGALYLVQLSSNAATSVNVTGGAALAGSVGVSIAANSTVAKQYTILSAAGGRSGTFTGVDTLGTPAGFVTSLSYEAGHAYLNFALDYTSRTDLNANQKAVATVLQNFFDTNGGINAGFAGRSATGLSQLSGEGATGSQQTTFGAMNQFMGLLTDPFVAGRDGGTGAGAVPFAEESATLAYAARNTEPRDALAAIDAKAPRQQIDFDRRWSIWAAGYGGSQSTSGNAMLGSNNTTSSVYGTSVGADYRFSPNTIAGFALAGGGTSFGTGGLGWGRSDLFQAGAFLRHNIGAAYLSAALAYGWQDITTDRVVTAAGTDHLRANFNANAWSGRLEGGYRTATPWMGLTPYAAAQFTSFELPAYAESVVSGAGTFALNYAAKSVTDVRSELGLRTDTSFAADGGLLTLRGRFAWAHDFNPERSAAAVFQTLPGAAFVVNGAAQASEAALTTASLEMRWRNGWSVGTTFEGEFSSVTRSYAGKGVMRYTW
ncbi:autotransporter domain-containing protein [uncultured Bradyrhizobium sp.]|uniref:autotransporter domain-containing protein n=1 Tax=uncultured Bradyrhizobium sp. TaxID=199684 RepID=UPI00261A1030|nr:autotransporter domain-containing protein [uncultured Bradyrhizobium sp.]